MQRMKAAPAYAALGYVGLQPTLRSVHASDGKLVSANESTPA